MSEEQFFTSIHFGATENPVTLRGQSPLIQKLHVEVLEMQNLEQQIHRMELEARQARSDGHTQRANTLTKAIFADQELLADDRQVIGRQLSQLTEAQWSEVRENSHLSVGLNILGFSVPN